LKKKRKQFRVFFFHQSSSEKKLDVKLLIGIYQNTNDSSGLAMTEQKLQEMEKNLEDYEKRKQDLRSELPPRPLPQPEFVRGKQLNLKLFSDSLIISVSAVAAKRASVLYSIVLEPPKALIVEDWMLAKPRAKALYSFQPSGQVLLNISLQ
jgi:hypothetical protein